MIYFFSYILKKSIEPMALHYHKLNRQTWTWVNKMKNIKLKKYSIINDGFFIDVTDIL